MNMIKIAFILSVFLWSACFINRLDAADTLFQAPWVNVELFNDLAAAVNAPETKGKTILIGSSVNCNNLSIPRDRALKVISGGEINISGFLKINGQFEASRHNVFSGNGHVSFKPGSIIEVLPEWFGAVADASVDGKSGIDSTAALQKVFDLPHPVRLGPGNYLFTNLTIPPEKAIRGYGIHQTNLVSKPGSTGIALTDKGNAAKITLEDFSVYANNNKYTDIIKLGYGTYPFGTEGLLNNIWVRDSHTAIGINVRANVGHFGRLLTQRTKGIMIIGSANMVSKVQSFGSSGFSIAGKVGKFCTYLQDTSVDGLEIEAPAAGTIPLYLLGNTQIDSLWLSFQNPIVDGRHVTAEYSHLIEIDPSATTWGINNLKLYLGASESTQAIITNGNFKSGLRFFGGNASRGSHDGEGNYASSMFLSGGMLAVKQQQLQSFTLRINNHNGVLQHRFGSSGNGSTPSNFVSRINESSYKFSVTPTGPDEITSFVGGGKISSMAKNMFILDTASQYVNDSLLFASIVFNSTGTAYSVIPLIHNSAINGIKQDRIAFALQNAVTGANVPFNELAIPPGKNLDINFIGFIK